MNQLRFPALPTDSQLQQQPQDDSASESAADISTYAPSNYDQDARLADAFEPEEFRGMLFHDGVDSQGRPVIVVNTNAVGTSRKARGQALQYMLQRLEPIVIQVTFYIWSDHSFALSSVLLLVACLPACSLCPGCLPVLYLARQTIACHCKYVQVMVHFNVPCFAPLFAFGKCFLLTDSTSACC